MTKLIKSIIVLGTLRTMDIDKATIGLVTYITELPPRDVEDIFNWLETGPQAIKRTGLKEINGRTTMTYQIDLTKIEQLLNAAEL